MADGYHGDGENTWEEENEEEEEDRKQRPESLKEKLIFLIDVQDNMFEEIELYGGTTTSFEAARGAVVELIKLKAVQHPDDQVAVILYNTREKDRPAEGAGGNSAFMASFEGVRTLLELQQPSAEAVRAVRDLTVEGFRETIGGLPRRRDSALADALFRVQNCLAVNRNAENSINTLVVFTNDPEPCGESGTSGFKAALTQLSGRVEALQGYRVGLRLFPLAAAVRPFDSGRLWRGLLGALRCPRGDGEVEADGGDEHGVGGGDGGDGMDDEALLRELATDPYQRRDPVAAITSLFDSFKRRLARKRTLMRLSWQVSEELKIAVRGYLLISDEAKNAKKTVPLNPVTNQPLKTTTTLVSTSDGRVLEREAITRKKAFRLKTGNTARLPELIFPAAEVSSSWPSGGAALVPPGLVLLGFKPLAPCLRLYHQMRPAVFLRPDERAAEGSTAAFIALWRAMLAEGRFALCRYKRGNSTPQLVALVPQDEAVDEYGIQTQPPGIHMIYLPYMDDVRHPETAANVPPQQPTDEQLAAANGLVAALDLEKVEPFDLTHVRNPWLQRHYQVVEALALSEPIPAWSAEHDDHTRPRIDMFEKPEVQAAVEAFRSAFPQAAAGRGTKRKATEAGATGGSGPAKKAQQAEAVADAYNGINWEAKLRSGELSRLTKDDLVVYLRRHQLKVTGKKDELVQRVSEHLGQQLGTR